MEVLSHRDPAAIAELVGAVRAGRLVCLLADRDLAGHRVPVHLAGQPITMPAGPAVVARRAGAALIPAVCQFTRATGWRSSSASRSPPRPGRDGLVAMTQEVADFFARTMAEQPEDWHMMQPFFADDAGPAEEPVRCLTRPAAAGRPGLPLLVRGARAACRTTSSAWPGICATRPRAVRARARGSSATSAGRHCSTVIASPPPARRCRVRYNGSVARVNFGPLSAARVRRWLRARRLRPAAHPRADHARASRCSRCGRPSSRSSPPSTPRPRGRGRMQLAGGVLRAAIGEARRRHRGLGVGPAGGGPAPRSRRRGHPQRPPGRRLRRADRGPPTAGDPAGPGCVFLGRTDEPRKGLDVLLARPAGDPRRGRPTSRWWSPARARRRLPAGVPGAGRGRRARQGGPARLRRRLRRSAPGAGELRHRAAGGAGQRRRGGRLRPAGLRRPAAGGRRHSPVGTLFPAGDHRALAEAMIGCWSAGSEPDRGEPPAGRSARRPVRLVPVGAAVLSVYQGVLSPQQSPAGRTRARTRNGSRWPTIT